ncbi:hypothetical protein [Actinokineospora enzanensis]|uniref:hypothetical protein n=1 Tax=Actinokineospora enzanensis TaxID=155975 RepID=UPI00036B9D1B|nr:hypothetical protein [Actinokineospora enzanensis]
MLLLTMVDGAAPVAAAWAVSLLLDELVAGRAPSTPAAGIAVLVAAGVLVRAIGGAQVYLQGKLHRDMSPGFRGRRTMTLPDDGSLTTTKSARSGRQAKDSSVHPWANDGRSPDPRVRSARTW